MKLSNKKLEANYYIRNILSITNEFIYPPPSNYLINKAIGIVGKMNDNRLLLKRPLNSASFCWTFPQDCEQITANLLG